MLRPAALALLFALFLAAPGLGLDITEPVEPVPALQDDLPPLHPAPPPDAPVDTPSAGAAALLEDAVVNIRAMYYGRARHADNRNRYEGDGQPSAKDKNEIHVNALGLGLDFRSGYAWGWLGFDVSGQTNLGRGNGWSEVLLHKEPGNRDRSSLSLGQAAVKTRFGSEELGFRARGGYTPISIGSIGTSAGINPHGYRGFEAVAQFRGWELGYGWADQFRNDWDNTFRDMTTSYGQGRYGDGYRDISFIHTIGLRRTFGLDNAGFVDLGVGEGRRYRKNAQLAASVPIDVGCWGVLTLTGYGHVARYTGNGPRYNTRTGRDDRTTEYHVSGQASLKTGDWTFATGLGHTRSPNSDEMQFRLTAWANSDNRNFIQTWGQLDDYVWDGQNVAKASVRYDFANTLPRLPGLAAGAVSLYGWNAANPGSRRSSSNWEIDYYVEYAFKDGWADGLAMGVYAAHLRYNNNGFHGKQNRNDVKVIVSYSRSLEGLFRRR